MSTEGLDALRREQRGPVLVITIDRPHRRNALDPETILALAQLLTDATADRGTAAVVLTAAGAESFGSGMDLHALATNREGAGEAVRALYAIMRWAAVASAAVGHGFTQQFLLALGVLSLAIAAFSLVLQRSYKRLLAYSSIEHIGLMCVGLALGPLGTFAAMLHLLSHALGKSVLFSLSGRMLRRYGSAEIGRVAGLLGVMPWTGTFFAVGVLAIAGLPPSGIFISEFALVRAGFATGHGWTMGLVLALLTVAFVGVLNHLNRMLYGTPPPAVRVGETERWSLLPPALGLTALVGLGVVIPAPLERLLAQIAEVMGK